MFTFALAGHRYFSFRFQPLSAYIGKRKKEFGRKHSQRKPLTTTTCVRRRLKHFSSFPKEDAFHSLEVPSQIKAMSGEL